MNDSFSNNATPKYLGYVYQVLIAIEQCFEAKNNQTIWIECFGDVYDGNTSTEVKHHFEESNLTNNSVDFWKTLKNLVTEDTSDINSFVLHTTQNIKDDSIFYGWNDLSKTKKYERLKNHQPSGGVQLFYDASIKNDKERDLLSILERLTIKSSQLKIEDKWEELKKYIVITIDDKHTNDALSWVYGYIHNKLIDGDKYRWHVIINDFNSACRIALSKYTHGKIVFPSVEESEISRKSDDSFPFVEEMKAIKLKQKSIEQAIYSYVKANIVRIKFFEKHDPLVICHLLDKHDNSILDSIMSLKCQYSDEMELDEIYTDKSFKVSRELYFNSINQLELINIETVDNIEKFYQNGRIHHNVNEGKFVWRICEDDLL